MVTDRENYCRLIGLNPYNESTYTYESIDSKISTKEKKWTKEAKDKQTDLDRRFVLNVNLSMVEDMRRVMKDPVQRSKEFDEGRKILKSKASKLNKDSVILHNGVRVLLPGTADNLAKKLGWDGVNKDDLVKISGISNTPVPQVVGPKVINAYKGIRDVGAYTPLDVLNELIGNPDLSITATPLREGCSLTELKTTFELCEKRVNNVKQDVLPTQDSYIQALRSIKTVLDDEKSITQFLKYGKCMKILVPAMNTMDEDYSQPFTREYIDNVLSIYLKNSNADQNMAIAILEEYCVKKKYLANFSTKNSKLTICPNCGGMTESGNGAMCCSLCGFSIKTKCPNCNTEQSSGNRSCIKCGFDFQTSFKLARQLESKVKSDIDSGLLQKADDDLKELRKTYATYAGIEDLSQRLRSATARYDQMLKNIDQSYKLRKYNSCKMYCESAKNEFPYIIEKEIEIRKKYEDSVQRINDAEGLCKKAESTADTDAKMALYVSAADRCPDHPATKAKMSQYPPESPADANVQIREDKALLKFAVPEDRNNMTFCIYRARDRLPIVTEDTVPLTEIPNSVFLDRTMDPGVDYYYSVYSKRFGILSKESANYGPVTVFVEVEDVTIEQIGGGLRINYKKPKGCSRVRIWRKEGNSVAGTGDEIEIKHNGESPLDDYGLKGGMKYNYLLVAEYENKGKTERSMGVPFSATTIKFPEPVRDMQIRWNKSDGSYTSKWKSKENVTLYSTPKKVTMYGRMVPITDLNSWMTEIQPMETYVDGMKFMIPDGSVQFIYPMIISGKMAVKGKEIMIANLKPFRDIETRISGNECDVTISWPNDVESAIVAIKEDSTVTDPDDITAEKITVTREAYMADKMIRIPLGSSKKRVITIFAQYDINGEKMNSNGISLDIFSGNYRKVIYTMEKTSSRSNEIHIKISTEPTVRELPPMCACTVTEGIPLKKWDGVNIWTSTRSVPLTNGSTMITVTSKSKVDLSKTRLFFNDDESYHQFKFIHPLYKEN